MFVIFPGFFLEWASAEGSLLVLAVPFGTLVPPTFPQGSADPMLRFYSVFGLWWAWRSEKIKDLQARTTSFQEKFYGLTTF